MDANIDQGNTTRSHSQINNYKLLIVSEIWVITLLQGKSPKAIQLQVVNPKHRHIQTYADSHIHTYTHTFQNNN